MTARTWMKPIDRPGRACRRDKRSPRIDENNSLRTSQPVANLSIHLGRALAKDLPNDARTGERLSGIVKEDDQGIRSTLAQEFDGAFDVATDLPRPKVAAQHVIATHQHRRECRSSLLSDW
jgi:hypothetical protein